MPRVRQGVVVAAALLGAVAALSACAQPAYTSDDARADLVAQGFTTAEADCVLEGLDRYFRDEFEQKQAAEGFEQIPKRQVDNYVRNKFAGVDDVPADLSDEAERLVRECRARV